MISQSPSPSSTMAAPAPTLTDLRTDSAIWYKFHVLIYDLRHFDQNPTSQSRLETVIDPSYLDSPYLTTLEADKIKCTRLESGQTISALIAATLEERLSRRMKKRVASGDYRVCSAHDVAPILEKALGIRPKDLDTSPAFLDMMAAKGLDVRPEETWTGLGKPQKNFHKKQGKKKGKD